MKTTRWEKVFLLFCILCYGCINRHSDKNIPVIDLSKAESAVCLGLYIDVFDYTDTELYPLQIAGKKHMGISVFYGLKKC